MRRIPGRRFSWRSSRPNGPRAFVASRPFASVGGALLVANLAWVVVFVFARAGAPFSSLWEGWIGNLAMVVPVAACFARALRGGPRRAGLRIAVDDYGTGYSSLAYLRDLPVDELKIDRSFVARIATDKRSAAIVSSTIDLAHALDLKVVAEGVELEDTLDALDALECDFAQGFHFSRALPAKAFEAWVRNNDESPVLLGVPA